MALLLYGLPQEFAGITFLTVPVCLAVQLYRGQSCRYEGLCGDN